MRARMPQFNAAVKISRHPHPYPVPSVTASSIPSAPSRVRRLLGQALRLHPQIVRRLQKQQQQSWHLCWNIPMNQVFACVYMHIRQRYLLLDLVGSNTLIQQELHRNNRNALKWIREYATRWLEIDTDSEILTEIRENNIRSSSSSRLAGGPKARQSAKNTAKEEELLASSWKQQKNLSRTD